MIIEINEARLGELAVLIRAGFAGVAYEFGLTPENAPTNGAFISEERLARQFARGVLMFAEQRGEKLVGTVALSGGENGVFELEKLCVLPYFRHMGIGRSLVAYAESDARSRGGILLKIGIIEANTRLREWYTELGFTHTGTAVFEQLPFVVGFMQKTL